jgi:hypothetical protein
MSIIIFLYIKKQGLKYLKTFTNYVIFFNLIFKSININKKVIIKIFNNLYISPKQFNPINIMLNKQIINITYMLNKFVIL